MGEVMGAVYHPRPRQTDGQAKRVDAKKRGASLSTIVVDNFVDELGQSDARPHECWPYVKTLRKQSHEHYLMFSIG
jgi:hypothetical protein